MQSPRERSKYFDEGGRAWYFAVGFVGAATAGVTGWIYSYIVPSRDTVVAPDAQGFLSLLIVAWYLAMGAGGVTAILGLLSWVRFPMKMRIMALPYGLLGLAWGLAWLGLMVAEISISKKNGACATTSDNGLRDGKVDRYCYQGDNLNWYPTYAATAVAFFQCLIWLGTCKHVLYQGKKHESMGDGMGELQIVVNGKVVNMPASTSAREREERAAALADEVWADMSAQREAWVEAQMRTRKVVEQGNAGVAPQPMPDLRSQAQAWREA